MTAVIKVENLSKQYRLGVIGSSTIKEDLQRWWYTARGKGDPFSKVTAAQSPAKKTTQPSTNSETILALDNVSFEVQQGEILGIIGRNGAGKSTLLKILSRVTAPTTGRIKVKGRIASLLEVGTGFHPELTGRENVFLNGAILGMTKAEVTRKFDEIVAFSEIEKFIDTPVKRYSSGMYVRLAFAVAAHLDPEILIVDEVLAVGDAAFQKKCIGKMSDVTRGGRTVLFVSHSMPTIATLCTRAILLAKGGVSNEGRTDDVVQAYIANNAGGTCQRSWTSDDPRSQGSHMRLLQARVLSEGVVTSDVRIEKPVSIEINFEVTKSGPDMTSSIQVVDKMGVRSFCAMPVSTKLDKGFYRHAYEIPGHLLNDGFYSITVLLITELIRYNVYIESAISFVVHDTIGREDFIGEMYGSVRPKLKISQTQINQPIAISE